MSGGTPWIGGRPVPLDHHGPVDTIFEPFEGSEPGLFDRLDLMAARHADRIAVDDGIDRLTYGELIRKARALAARIDAETPPDRPIALVMRYTVAFPVALLACLASGRLFIPVDALHPAERKQVILRNSGAQTLLLQQGVDVGDDLPDWPRLLFDLDELDDETAGWPAGRFDPDAPAGVVYTSGSTGNPKGLAWSVNGLMMTLIELTHTHHLNPDDKYIALGSLSSAGMGDALLALLNGATLRVVEIMQAGVGELLRILGEERITVMSFVPAILRSVLQMDGAPEAFRHLRILDLYGDATLASDIAFFRTKLPKDCHIRLVLGSMEASAIFHWFVPADFDEPGLSLPCGYLALDREVAVLDEAGRPVGVGEEGEIVIRSRRMALGAWQDGRMTAGPFLTDPDDPAVRIYPMGDIVRLRADGLAEFVGRRDRQVKIRGLRADLGEVEAALRQHPAIADVAVVAVQGDADTEIVAYCVFREGEKPTSAALRTTVVRETAEHMAPGRLFAMDAIPRLPNWKPDLVLLAQRASVDLDTENGSSPVVADDVDEEILAAVEQAWAATLGERAQPGLSWASSGGDSLEELQLMHRIEDALGLELPHLLDIDHRPSDLARAIEAHMVSADFVDARNGF